MLMLDKKGQTLILFVILIPLIIGIAAFVIDTGVIVLEKAHLKEVCKMVIEEKLLKDELDIDGIKSMLERNDVDVSNVRVEVSNDSVNIKNEYMIDSLFGSIIGLKEYKIKIDITGYIENGKVIYD